MLTGLCAAAVVHEPALVQQASRSSRFQDAGFATRLASLADTIHGMETRLAKHSKSNSAIMAHAAEAYAGESMDYGEDYSCDEDLDKGRACCSYRAPVDNPGWDGCETCQPLDRENKCPVVNNEGGMFQFDGPVKDCRLKMVRRCK